MTNYSEIIARLEASEGADRELDVAVCVALRLPPPTEPLPNLADGYELVWTAEGAGPWYRRERVYLLATSNGGPDSIPMGSYTAPVYTDSITGPGLCLGLVVERFPDAVIGLTRDCEGAWEALIMNNEVNVTGDGKTAPTALLSALFQALAQDTGGK